MSDSFNRDYQSFIDGAKRIATNRVFTSPLTTYAYGIDASCYSYTPRAAIFAHNETEVAELIKLANLYNTPITFRAAGSSLSGQALSDSILIIANDGFKSIEILDNGDKIRLQCGVIGNDANIALKNFNRKIGPDPATINTALIGGIIANNSSGMCCGIEENSYKTIDSVRIILNDGAILDTSIESSLQNFMQTHAHIVENILKLRDQILQDTELQKIISHKYKIKNTTGYSINALLDFSDIKDIINNIIVGSEGTLCFISKVVLRSVKEYENKASCLLFFNDIYTASRAITKLATLDRQTLIAAEIMDYECLLSASRLSEFSPILENLQPNTTCILLQTQSNNKETLNANLESIKSALQGIPTNRPSLFSTNEQECALWWKMRKSLLPLSAKNRPSASVVITEDICFSIDRFCEGVELIQNLFNKHAFKGIVFGHALSGNLHFIITPNLSKEDEVARFKAFMHDLAHGVSALDGSIKAEHGTGRMVAPFVELEWGSKAYEIHKRVKEIFDSKNLLNPHVIISNDKDIYAKRFKGAPPLQINTESKNSESISAKSRYKLDINKSRQISSFIEHCMDCGFCERACPSKFLTLTPRQRIASIKEIARLQDSTNAQDKKRAQEMLAEYQYYGITTCATCSMCSMLCPIEIDCAHIANILSQKPYNPLAALAYNHMDITLKLAKGALFLGNMTRKILGERRAFNFSLAFHNLMLNLSKKYNINALSFTPILPSSLPRSNNYTLRNNNSPHINPNANIKEIIYFSACMNRAFKGAPNDKSLQEIIESICKKANVRIIYPRDINNLCCGKAFSNIDDIDNQSLIDNLLQQSNNGAIPIILDHSACSAHMLKKADHSALKIMDITQFLYIITESMPFQKTDKNIIIHQMCALKKTKQQSYILELSKRCGDHIHVIESMECCGFSGYKGIFHPELNESSLKNLKQELQTLSAQSSKAANANCFCVSSSVTCEIGLSHHCEMPFQNIAYLVDSCLL